MAPLPTALLALNALLFFLLEVTAAEKKTITAESGQNVTLTCRAPNNNNNTNNITLVQWGRADLKPEYVFVYRVGYFVPDQHASFKNRVDLQDKQMKDGNVSVILKNVTINDTGTYECRVLREDGTMELMNTTYLSVVAPPGQPGGITEDGRSVGVIVIAGLSGSALVAAVVVLLIYSKHLQQRRQGSSL